MKKEILNKSCCENNLKSNGIEEKDTLCPVCGHPGEMVKNITVKHLVLDSLIEQM